MANKAVESSEFTTVTEGKATILFPKDHVFYNPVQQFNRDLSVATYFRERMRYQGEETSNPTKRQNVYVKYMFAAKYTFKSGLSRWFATGGSHIHGN